MGGGRSNEKRGNKDGEFGAPTIMSFSRSRMSCGAAAAAKVSSVVLNCCGRSEGEGITQPPDTRGY